MKKELAILFASSETFAYAMFVSIKSLFKNSPLLANKAEIYIYAYRWANTTKKIFTDNFPVTIYDYELPDYVPETYYTHRFTPSLFARFEGFKLLDNYKRVICMDSDILVQKELYNDIDRISEGIALTKDSSKNLWANFVGGVPGYDMERICYNAGFIVLRDTIPYQNIHPWLYKMLAKYADRSNFADQGFINLVLQEFNLQPLMLPQIFNQPASSPNRELKKAFIIHSTGHRKFWSYYYFEDWYNLYKDWLKAGGKPNTYRVNTQAWNKLMEKVFLPKKDISIERMAFFQLAPDFFKYPGKFMLYTVKHLFHIAY